MGHRRAGTLEERYAAIRKLKEPGLSVAYFSEFTYDRQAVRALTDEVAARLTVEPKNASVVAFNVTDRTFAFSDEQMGQRVDAEALYQTVVAMLDQGSYGATVPVSVQTVSPSVTRAQLEANYGLISTYTTKTTSNENRNTNIRLAAEAFNGLMIAPGEEISFNETTGERTREKGYLEAGAIENGRTVQEVGGGVCQVSSTLFNTLCAPILTSSRAGPTPGRRTMCRAARTPRWTGRAWIWSCATPAKPPFSWPHGTKTER